MNEDSNKEFQRPSKVSPEKIAEIAEILGRDRPELQKSNIPPPPVKPLTNEEFIELLEAREKDAENRASFWKFNCKALLWIMVLVPVIGWSWIKKIAAPTYITVEEHSVSSINYHKRTWFGDDTVIRLEARPNGYGSYDWMSKDNDGGWSEFFHWTD